MQSAFKKYLMIFYFECFYTLSVSSRILDNFLLSFASPKFYNTSALLSFCCSLNCISFNLCDFLSVFIFSLSTNKSALINSFLLALAVTDLNLDLDDQ